jgi:hypothetical protein
MCTDRPTMSCRDETLLWIPVIQYVHIRDLFVHLTPLYKSPRSGACGWLLVEAESVEKLFQLVDFALLLVNFDLKWRGFPFARLMLWVFYHM